MGKHADYTAHNARVERTNARIAAAFGPTTRAVLWTVCILVAAYNIFL